MPRVMGSSSESNIWIIEIKVRDFSGTSLGIQFGILYPMLHQLSPGVLFRDEFWERLEP